MDRTVHKGFPTPKTGRPTQVTAPHRTFNKGRKDVMVKHSSHVLPISPQTPWTTSYYTAWTSSKNIHLLHLHACAEVWAFSKNEIFLNYGTISSVLRPLRHFFLFLCWTFSYTCIQLCTLLSTVSGSLWSTVASLSYQSFKELDCATKISKFYIVCICCIPPHLLHKDQELLRSLWMLPWTGHGCKPYSTKLQANKISSKQTHQIFHSPMAQLTFPEPIHKKQLQAKELTHPTATLHP